MIGVVLIWHMLVMNLTVHLMTAPPVSHLKRWLKINKTKITLTDSTLKKKEMKH